MLSYSLFALIPSVIIILAYGAIAGISFFGFRKTHLPGFMALGIAFVCWTLAGLQPLLILASSYFRFSFPAQLNFSVFPLGFMVIRLAGIVICGVGVSFLMRDYPSHSKES